MRAATTTAPTMPPKATWRRSAPETQIGRVVEVVQTELVDSGARVVQGVVVSVVHGVVVSVGMMQVLHAVMVVVTVG